MVIRSVVQSTGNDRPIYTRIPGALADRAEQIAKAERRSLSLQYALIIEAGMAALAKEQDTADENKDPGPRRGQGQKGAQGD